MSTLPSKLQHADVEGRRFVETAHGVVEQEIGVLEEPGGQYEGQGDAHQAGLGGKGEKHCEYDQNTGGSAAGGAEEVGEVRVIHSIL